LKKNRGLNAEHYDVAKEEDYPTVEGQLEAGDSERAARELLSQRKINILTELLSNSLESS
jgi:hypothetical protein